ncbi:MAG: apolipoprotein N-acyltransferase [Calditrichaeota bacterium]|nr:MAG: apolipoprotein N-acyltransferase [Calditrichota bacterium]
MKKNFSLALLTGILFALSFPPFKTGFLAYGALVPLFLLIIDKSGKDAWRWGYISGLFIACTTVFWIGWITLPGLIGVLLVWPLYIAFFAWLFSRFHLALKNVAFVFVPFLWTAIEYFQSVTELAFPWVYLGYTQSYYLPLIQFAELTSVYGVSFWVVLLNTLIFQILQNRKKHRKALLWAGIVFLCWIIPFIYGTYVMKAKYQGSDTVRVTLVQANLDPNEKWSPNLYDRNFGIYENLTVNEFSKQPDLVVWPETAITFYLRSEAKYQKRIHDLIDSSRVSLLTGSLDYQYLADGSYVYYNAAFLIEPQQSEFQSYSKMKLVPFSERVPYNKFIFFKLIKKAFWNLGLGDYAIGEKINIFTAYRRDTALQEPQADIRPSKPDYKTAVAICYESVFPSHIQKYVNEGANFLVIITNDAWFGPTSAPFQHNQIAVFRAIETRKAIARCANTGISCFIDKFGRVDQSTRFFTQKVITGDVQVNDESTFFLRHGLWFVKLNYLICGIALLYILTISIKRS